MAAGDLITNDFEVEFDGVLAGEGSPYKIELINIDLFTSPTARVQPIDRSIDHGAFFTQSFYSGKRFIGSFEVWGDNDEEFKTNLTNALKFSTLTQEEIPLVCQLPGFGKVQYNCRAMKRSVQPVDMDHNIGKKAILNVEYYATNPRLLSTEVTTNYLDFSTSFGGLSYDLTYPLVYATSGPSIGDPNFIFPTTHYDANENIADGALSLEVIPDGSIKSNFITNSGNFETRPVITVYGPFTAFTLESVTQSKSLNFSGVTLAESEFVVIDFLEKTVLLNGTSSRYNWLVSSQGWWSLQPGQNEIRLSGATTGDPYALVEWQSAWA